MYTLVLESSKFGWKKNGCSFRWFFKEQRTYWYWLLPWCLCSSFTFWSKRQRTWGATKIDHHENEKRCCVCLHLARKKWPIKYWSISSLLLRGTPNLLLGGDDRFSSVIIIERSLFILRSCVCCSNSHFICLKYILGSKTSPLLLFNCCKINFYSLKGHVM